MHVQWGQMPDSQQSLWICQCLFKCFTLNIQAIGHHSCAAQGICIKCSMHLHCRGALHPRYSQNPSLHPRPAPQLQTPHSPPSLHKQQAQLPQLSVPHWMLGQGRPCSGLLPLTAHPTQAPVHLCWEPYSAPQHPCLLQLQFQQKLRKVGHSQLLAQALPPQLE